jgi:glycosyltransferase involved in cell wall biosynthesis
MKALRKICILGLDDYPMLSGGSGYIGGENVQHVLLARAWRDLGLEVSIIVHDHGQPRETVIEGIRAIAAHAPQAGIPMLRFVHPRMTSVVRALRAADADVYYQSPSSLFTGVAVWFARRHGRRSIVRIASDLGCIPGRQLIRYWRDRKLYEYGLRHASLIAAQTQQQRELLQRHYGLNSAILNMAVELPPAVARPADKDIDVLWVGNLRAVKRPELVLELARRLPQYTFTMAGGPVPTHQEYFDDFVREARELPNLRLLGPVPYQGTGALFERARVHLNTSSAEGFPNTFLQSWVRGVPVVSFFDPDRLISSRGLGRAVAGVDEMESALRELLQDPQRRAADGERGRAFAATEFSASCLACRYLELLEAAAERDVAMAGIDRAVASSRQ